MARATEAADARGSLRASACDSAIQPTRLWGSSRVTYPDRLAPTLTPQRGAIKITYAAGTTSMPAEIEYAATLMVSMIYGRRTIGIPTQSESWNGESVGYASQFLMTSAIHSPDVQELLMPYLPGLRVA